MNGSQPRLGRSAAGSERPPIEASPRRDGLMDRLVRLPARLPGPDLVWFVVLLVALLVVGHLPVWVTGETPVGEVAVYVLLPVVITVYFLGLIRVMRRVSESAFEDFRPALGRSADEEEQFAHELVRIPDRGAAVAIVGAILALTAFASLPDSASGDLPPIGNASAWTLWGLTMATLALAVFYTLRQLRWVSRLHAIATNVDLFDTAPVNALSRLTATSGIGILVVALVFLFGSDDSLGDDPSARTFPLLSGLALVLLSIALFASPLRGMHRRLVAEKARLLRASTERMKQTMALIHGTVDTKDFGQADQLQKTLTSLLAEREVLGRLPTWPWTPGTLRGFATAAGLPVLLWLLFRFLERVV